MNLKHELGNFRSIAISTLQVAENRFPSYWQGCEPKRNALIALSTPNRRLLPEWPLTANKEKEGPATLRFAHGPCSSARQHFQARHAYFQRRSWRLQAQSCSAEGPHRAPTAP